MKLAHPGALVHDELVPSRYALNVGDIDVTVISDGTMQIEAETLATNAAQADLSAWLGENFLPEMLVYPINVAVVRSGGRTVLVDSGLGAEFPSHPRVGQLARRLDAAGIDPGSVTDVVLTHLHMDHIGGLLVEGFRGRLRTDLRVHLASAEAEFWEAPDFSRTAMPEAVPAVLRASASKFLDVYRSQLKPFEKEHEVAPGVTIVRTGGHTPGHSIVRLESGGDRLTFVGDAVFQCGFDRPGWYNGFEHDPEESARVRVRLLTEMAASGERLLATHVPFPSLCHVAAAGDAFRFVPTVWDH
ncbi:MBL fold metallo-hydrolase [Streptomyces sp. NPDC048411]|uniref:MBL fold metallo-hydrolase n=1 Tax=unclassified Streptomyces TaxID=2593676 RepID=UPI00345262C6